MIIGDDQAYLPIYGGEAVRMQPAGDVVGRLRSVAYGYEAARTVGYVHLPRETQEGQALSVDVLGSSQPAVVAADVLHDPTGERMRG